jgi:serine/threonine protein kinase
VEADRVKVNDFQSLKVIGKGSFGKVLQVRYKKTGQIFAMKVLNKKTILDRNELVRPPSTVCRAVCAVRVLTVGSQDHTRAEKNILMRLTCPFLVRLYYSFQTQGTYSCACCMRVCGVQCAHDTTRTAHTTRHAQTSSTL